MNDSLGDRMKCYEQASSYHLPRRLPVIIRVDGRAFHTWTKWAHKPFDDFLRHGMVSVATALCDQIDGARFAFVQSDEVSVLVCNDTTINTQPWFDNDLSKMCSISASIATLAMPQSVPGGKGAQFDARAFVLPPDEVTNYFIWRQQDATRNSIQMAARAVFSHSACRGLNNNQLQEKLWSEKSINWNDYPTRFKRGTAITTDEYGRWITDHEPPIFTQIREYIEQRLEPTERKDRPCPLCLHMEQADVPICGPHPHTRDEWSAWKRHEETEQTTSGVQGPETDETATGITDPYR